MRFLTTLLLLIQFNSLAQNRVYADVTTAIPNVGILYINNTVPAGNTIVNTSVETFFASSYTIPANTLKMGDVLVVKVRGYYSTTTIAPTLRGRVYLNNTLVNDSGNTATITGVTNGGWFGEAFYNVMVIGSTGSIDSQAYLQFQSGLVGALCLILPNINALTIDTTIDQTIKISATWSGASIGNSITLRQMLVYKHRLP